MSSSPLLQLRRTHSLGTNSSCDSSSDESRTNVTRRRCGLISRTNVSSSTRSLTNLSLRKTMSSISFHSCLLLVTLSQIVVCDKVPDQIAMAAEHRIGIHGGGPQGVYGPPPQGFHGGPGSVIGGGGGGQVPLQGGGGPPGGDTENWPLQSSQDMPQIKILQVQCEKSHMRVNIEFDRPFYGMIFSKGHYSDPHCVHLAPGSGHLSATFDIYLNACGMTSSANNNGGYGPAPSGTFVENTIIVQYDPLVQEVWDQARKLRCTWYDFYEKSVTFRPFQVDMLHAVTANFLGDNLQCWMQIQVGKGPWASEVSGIVKIGQTMTMVLAIKDDENKFDMLVRNCVAHDGKRAPIQLVDQYGCVTRPKIMSRFHKIKNFGASASVVSYAHFQAFKFPDSMNVHFQCVIQVCRFQCPEPKCGGGDAYGPPEIGHGGLVDPRSPHGAYSENKESVASSQAGPQNGDQQTAGSVQQPQIVAPPPPSAVQNGNNNPGAHPTHNMGGPPPPSPPGGFSPPHQLGGPMPQPSHVMLPPPQRTHSTGYSSVKREGTVAENEEDEEEEEDDENSSSGPSYAALGGRPRSVDFDKAERTPRSQRERRAAHDEHNEHQFFTVHINHVYKRSAQEMTDVETTRVIQVVAPGDVAFNLGNSNATAESVVIESSSHSDIDGICMSVSSFVVGLVLLLLLLVVASLVAAFLFVRVRSIHRKTAVFAGGFDNPEYLKNPMSS